MSDQVDSLVAVEFADTDGGVRVTGDQHIRHNEHGQGLSLQFQRWCKAGDTAVENKRAVAELFDLERMYRTLGVLNDRW